MSDLLIKDMKMPKNCDKCMFRHECEMSLRLSRPPFDCPLIEIPSHGRLIDASEEIIVQVYEDQYEDYRSVKMTIDDLLLHQSWIYAEAPTVIPESYTKRIE